MRDRPLMALVAVVFALAACNQSSPQSKSAETAGNVAVPAADGLWGVAEAEDEASHRGLDFIAFNHSGRTVAALFIRPDEGPLAPGVAETSWSANVLTQSELPDGQRAAAHYEADIELCSWQLRATFGDGQTRDYPGTNLCETVRVDLR